MNCTLKSSPPAVHWEIPEFKFSFPDLLSLRLESLPAGIPAPLHELIHVSEDKGNNLAGTLTPSLLIHLQKRFWSRTSWKRQMSVNSLCLIFLSLSLQMESSAGKRRRGWSWHCQKFPSVTGCTLGDWWVIGNGTPAVKMNDQIWLTHFPYWKWPLAAIASCKIWTGLLY